MSALPPVVVPFPCVEVSDHVLAGSPIVRGTAVPVRRLWAWHRRGVSVEVLVKRYPRLGWAKVLGALAFAYENQELVDADLEREQALVEAQAEERSPAIQRRLDHVVAEAREWLVPDDGGRS